MAERLYEGEYDIIDYARLYQMGREAYDNLWATAQRYGRDVKLYLHWTACPYNAVYGDYHINIGPDGEQLGVMMRRSALEKAYDMNMDLLCVAPNAKTPVCKIVDYGRYRFEEQKKAREAKKKQHVTEIKPLRVSPVIDENDFNTKLNQARKWIEEGQKVRIDMRFRGRMITRQEVGKEIISKFTEAISDIAEVSKSASLEGNTMSVIFSPKKGK